MRGAPCVLIRIKATMVQPLRVELNFRNLGYGQNTTPIADTGASLLTLPGIDERHKLVASSGPSNKEVALTFWKEVVLGQDASLVINLCGNVAPLTENEFNWYADCTQYWPLTTQSPVELEDQECIIQVSLLCTNSPAEKLI